MKSFIKLVSLTCLSFLFYLPQSQAIDPVSLEIESFTGNPGESECISFMVSDFKEVAAMQFSIQFDPNLMKFESISNMSLPGMEIGETINVEQAESGIIRVVWFDLTALGQSLDNGSELFDMCFTISPDAAQGSCSSLSLVNSPTLIEFVNINGTTVDYKQDPGSLCVTSQVVISEIMYNPPESGTDSLEFIEIYNPSAEAVDMTGWELSQGAEFTFPEFTLNPGEYVVVAVDTSAMKVVFGIDAFQWDSGGLSNGGEDIELTDLSDMVTAYVEYDSGGDWPDEANGNGASLEFCINTQDNNNSDNWRASTNATGVTVNGKEILASPGAANSVTCEVEADIIVTLNGTIFEPKDITINEGQTVLWKNESGFHNINGSLETYPDNPEGFFSGEAANAPFEFAFTFDKPGFYNYQCDVHISAGMVGTVTVLEEQIDVITIEEAREIDEDGLLVKFGETVALQGYVHGINIRPGGLQFTIINTNNVGIQLFKSSDDLGYTVSEGDHIQVSGELGMYNGLAQLNLGDKPIEIIDDGIFVVTPDVVTELSESTESSLITIENVELVDPGEWNTDGGSFNVDVTNGSTIFEMRVDNDTDIAGQTAPLGVFNLTGLGNQFDSSSPYTEGYQIHPRYMADIDPYVQEEVNYTLRTIGEMTSVNEEGVADSLDMLCELRGVVYGVNLRPSGLEFTIINQNNDGIGVFNFEGDLGYTINEGDEVSVKGVINQFNGLIQINPDSINLLSSGNQLFDPMVVTSLGEQTESQFIRVENAVISDPTEWEGDGGSFNVQIEIAGEITMIMRIDGDTELADMSIPGEMITVTGIGTQYDDESPFDGGYQIIPRYASDIEVISSVDDLSLLDSKLHIYPNPTQDRLSIETDLKIERIFVYNILGQMFKKIDNPQMQISLSDLDNGNYYIQFVTEEGIVSKEMTIIK